jgi:transposase
VARGAARGIRAQKKRPRPREIDRPDVQRKRATYRRWRRRVDGGRLIFIDDAGANLAMGRSHAWVQKGTEHVEPRPMNWGNNLTLIGAIDQQGWVALGTQWTAATSESFVAWVRDRLAPKLRAGDIVVLDNLRAHHDPRVRRIIQARGARVRFLPPYSYDYNPIESAWALLKKRIRAFAPRTGAALRRVARAARHVVKPHHCRQWYAHAGYANSSTNRG